MPDRTVSEDVSSAIGRSGYGQITLENRHRLEAFAEEVALWSAKMHLIGRGSIRKNLGLLVLDSLLLLRSAEESGLIPKMDARSVQGALKVADIGSGAGFPGIVWKIARPDLAVTLFERKERAHAFLERIITTLALPGLSAVSEDAERHTGHGSFDVVTSKAAGRLAALVPLAERLLAPGGVYLTIKGAKWREELSGVSPGAMRFLAAAELAEGRGIAVSFRKTAADEAPAE
jgi:16S rRNA (guanine(527)-N(7))-methyltransferase RsmG